MSIFPIKFFIHRPEQYKLIVFALLENSGDLLSHVAYLISYIGITIFLHQKRKWVKVAYGLSSHREWGGIGIT